MCDIKLWKRRGGKFCDAVALFNDIISKAIISMILSSCADSELLKIRDLNILSYSHKFTAKWDFKGGQYQVEEPALRLTF